MTPVDLIFGLLILIFSVIAHELAHGYVAEMLGDPTARIAGRLTINPIKHVDPIGSLLVPAISFGLGGFIFGWAKPVPYNPYNLRKGRFGEGLVAASGALVNIFLAVVFALIIRFFSDSLSPSFIHLASLVALTNITLAIFNLLPIPPLDGSKVLFSILPLSLHRVQESFERFSLPLLFILVFFLWQFVTPLIYAVHGFLIGIR